MMKLVESSTHIWLKNKQTKHLIFKATGKHGHLALRGTNGKGGLRLVMLRVSAIGIHSCTDSRRPVTVTLQDLYKAKEIDSPCSHNQNGEGGMHTLCPLLGKCSNLSAEFRGQKNSVFEQGMSFPENFQPRLRKKKNRVRHGLDKERASDLKGSGPR